MKCYQCALSGIDEDAVAICVVCGMGLCMKHALREELPVIDVIDWGLGLEQVKYPFTLPRFICSDCKYALDQKKQQRAS